MDGAPFDDERAGRRAGLVELLASKASLTGLMTVNVQGHGAMIRIAPTRKAESEICHHASIPKRKPTTASGACIAAPRL
jgi:hypothetical protein